MLYAGLLVPCQSPDLYAWCRHLADSSRGLQTAMDLVLDYEQRSHTALAHLLGRSWTFADLLFHAACAATALSAGALRARLPVLLGWLCSHLLERFLLGACSPLLTLNSDGQVSPLPSFPSILSLLPSSSPSDHKLLAQYVAVTEHVNF